MSKTWTYNFEEILGVIRAHPHAGVARLFLSMKSYKAAAMGLTKMLAAFKVRTRTLACAITTRYTILRE